MLCCAGSRRLWLASCTVFSVSRSAFITVLFVAVHQSSERMTINGTRKQSRTPGPRTYHAISRAGRDAPAFYLGRDDLYVGGLAAFWRYWCAAGAPRAKKLLCR